MHSHQKRAHLSLSGHQHQKAICQTLKSHSVNPQCTLPLLLSLCPCLVGSIACQQQPTHSQQDHGYKAVRQSAQAPLLRQRVYLFPAYGAEFPSEEERNRTTNTLEPPTPPTHHAMAGGRPVRDRQPTLSDKDWLDQNRANSGLCCCLHSRMSVLLVHLCMSLCVPAAACATHLRSTSSL